MITHAPIHRQMLPNPGIVFSAKDRFSVDEVPKATLSVMADGTLAVNAELADFSEPHGSPFSVSADGSWMLSSSGQKSREITVIPSPKAWSNSLEREFQGLAAAEVLEDATAEEHERFVELQRLRRRLTNPRSPEEVLFEIRRDMMLDELIALTNKYVRFIEIGPSRPAVTVETSNRSRRRSEA